MCSQSMKAFFADMTYETLPLTAFENNAYGQNYSTGGGGGGFMANGSQSGSQGGGKVSKAGKDCVFIKINLADFISNFSTC